MQFVQFRRHLMVSLVNLYRKLKGSKSSKQKILFKHVRPTTRVSLKSQADRESFFAIFVFNPDVFSLFSWLLGDMLASVSLFPEDGIELTMF